MMRLRWLPILVAACVALAGCSASGDAAAAQGKDRGLPDGVSVQTAPGVVTGVVVDVAIRPLEGATVTLQGDGFNGTATTDQQGVFRFEAVPPGTYVLSGEHRLYKKAQMAIEVKKSVDTPVARLMLEATFTQTPYSLAFKFDGILNCGYEAVLISAPCVTDYTSVLPVCPGGCAPELRRVQGDTRDYLTSVGPGWKSLVLEMTWESSAAGTSENMAMLISFEKRTAQHWFGLVEGERPLRMELRPGEPGPGAQIPSGMDDSIAAEGREDLLVLGSVRAGDSTAGQVGVAIQQKFTIFQHTFYHAGPPEGWSFLAGDQPPF